MQRSAIKRLVAILLAFHWNVASCIRKSSPSTMIKQDSLTSIPVPETETDVTNAPGLEGYLPLSQRDKLGLRIQDASLVDTLFALSLCDCLPDLQWALTKPLNDQRGALPQALTPAIRREILGNSKIKLLENIPRPLDTFIGELFASEETIAREISAALFDKIKKADPDLRSPEAEDLLQLDSFPALPGTQTELIGNWVRMVDVWSRWGLILSQAGPWTQSPESRPKHAVSWLELLRVLAEAEYLFGIASNSDGVQWGGLTLPVDLQITHPGPFDPRKPINQVRFLTGTLDLTLPNNNSLALARSGGERWTWRRGSVTLAEQSLQWWVSAKMLNRLRPANRGQMAKHFLSDGIFPEDGYQLPLLVLPGIGALLGDRFIDESTRKIQAEIIDPQVAGVSQITRRKADPQTLSLLLLALAAWHHELTDLSDLNVSEETEAQLRYAPLSLQRGAQLIAQTLLNEHLRARTSTNSDDPASAWTVRRNSTEPIEYPIRDHAQVLTALITAEQGILKSPYLRERIKQLAVGLALRWQEQEEATKQKMTLAQIIWQHRATMQFLVHYPDTPIAQIMNQQASELLQMLINFERSILQ